MRLRLPEAPLRRQVVWATSSLTALAMLLLTVLTQVVLAWTVSGNIDSVLRDRIGTAQSLVEAGGTPIAADLDELTGDVAVFDAAGAKVSGSLPSSDSEAVSRLTRARTERFVTAFDSTRFLAVPVTVDGDTFVVVAAESVLPYERAERYALVLSLVLGAVTVAGVGALTSWTVRRTLAPVAAMAATADDWSAHDLSRRFDLGPATTELTALGATLDGLLDRVSTALRAEQRLTAEMAHELRTPLTALIGAADVEGLRDDLDAQTREVLEDIGSAARRMAETVTTLVLLARAGDRGLAETSTLGEIVGGVADGDVEVRVEPVELDVHVAVPASLAVRALTPLLDNARGHRRSNVSLAALVSAEHVDLVVEDDGPGVDPTVGDVFAPGVRESGSAGAGLGLPLSRRIARAAGGDVSWEPGETGARFLLRLPRR